MLKFIASPVVGFIVYLVSALIALSTGIGILPNGNLSVTTAVVCIIAAAIATIVVFNLFPKKTVKESLSESISFVKNTANDISAMAEKDVSGFYAIAEQEIIDGEINKGLWSQALVVANGDESKRKIEYMNLRVKQLKNS